MTTTQSNTVTVAVQVDLQELMENIMGACWDTWEWWRGYDYAGEYAWDEYPTDRNAPYISLWVTDPMDDDGDLHITKTLSVQDIVTAFGETLRECSHLRWDNMDAIGADLVMQTAVLGRVIYG